MNRSVSAFRALTVGILLSLSTALVAADKKKALDHSDYDRWNSITGSAISHDAAWIYFTIKPGKGDSTLHIKATESKIHHSIQRGTSARFTHDSKYAIYLIAPDSEELKKAREAKKPAEAQPKSSLEILDLSTGKKTRFDRIRSFRLPDKAGGWLAYLAEPPIPPKRELAPEPSEVKSKREKKPQKSEVKEQSKGKVGTTAKDKSKEKSKAKGTDLVLRQLNTGAEYTYPHVTEYTFTENGKRLAFATSGEKPEDDGVTVITLGKHKVRQIISGRGNYRSLNWDESGNRLAFLTDRDDYGANKSSWSIYYWNLKQKKAELLINEESEGIPENWWIAQSRGPSFSKNGRRLFFGTQPKPEPAPKPTKKKDSDPNPKVKVDVWHWQDPLLQPMQLLRAKSRANQNYEAVIHLDSQKIIQLADEEIRSVTVGAEGNAQYALGLTNRPYRMEISWEYPRLYDVHLIDVNTGSRTKVLNEYQGRPSLSPQAKYLSWYDKDKMAWFVMSVKKKKPINVTKSIPYPLYNELHDQPSLPSAYGDAGWIKDDRALLVYDKHDIWAVDPRGHMPPVCVTDEFGRKHHLRFRYMRVDREERAIDPDERMLLSAFHLKNKSSGFYRDEVHATEPPRKLIMLPERLGRPDKADDADRVLFTRSTFRKFPDLWVANTDFAKPKRMSNANPQQKNYRWGTAELVSWNSLDGIALQGILYKPEGFNEQKKYPMMVYFYERLSDRLHRYIPPAADRASINISFYVSRGYVVFVPDIPYHIGHPGQSCLNAVLPGVTELISRGFIDKDCIGVQGHSWGGYQIAYLVTRTNLFAAAEAGAPVSNMT